MDLHAKIMIVMSWIKFAVPAGVLVTASLWSTIPAAAKPEYTRRLKQSCEVCHPPDSRALNEAGEYFRDHRSLDGYKPRSQGKKSAEAPSKRK